MSGQSKREHEELCMRAALKQIGELKGYHIDTSRADSGREEERPDFLLIKDGHRIGVEHFLVDTLLKRLPKGDKTELHSLSRRVHGEMMDIYDRYVGEKVDGKEAEALREIEKEINLNFERQTNFSYLSFISEFYRITHKHVKNISQYMSENGINTVGFICEIDVSDGAFTWDVTKNGKTHRQRIAPIPMTVLMWLLIHELLEHDFIDFFIVEAVPNITSDPVKNAKAVCYTKGSQPGKLFDSFTYRYRNISCELNLSD